MAAFRARFLARCRDELEVFRSGADGELRAASHRLAGMAGTVGYPQLSTLAQRLDEQLSEGKPADPADRAALVTAIEALIG
ncbi:Hpt domain-containing protein [Phenylobacterium sp.]|uniref:Hpt domain-containing protein n=1 Tax=Phenylobacterium sp. TaxID=1871053 RepID=UPI002E37CFDA|nr:Hpt domain-containing protein [Phenylobacterium sp.]HEX2559464.1 Hpt domain-containing protein [Phenylobacterium sp.]